MCLSCQRTAPVHGQHKHEHEPKQTALNHRLDINYISTAHEQEKDDESSSNDEYIPRLGRNQAKQEYLKPNVEINGVEMKTMIDMGASTDITDEAAIQKI